MEHTKGEWIAKLNNDDSWVVMSGNIVIATLHRKDWPEWNEANAHLIAAAPDLLAACKKGPAPNVFAQFADFAEECMTKPSMAVYKGHFSGLAVFLRSCVSRSEESLQALAKAEKE